MFSELTSLLISNFHDLFYPYFLSNDFYTLNAPYCFGYKQVINSFVYRGKVHAQSIMTLARVFIIKVVIVLLSSLIIQFQKNFVVSVAFIVAKYIFQTILFSWFFGGKYSFIYSFFFFARRQSFSRGFCRDFQ